MSYSVENDLVPALARPLRGVLENGLAVFAVHLCDEIQQRPFRTWKDYWKDVSDWLAL